MVDGRARAFERMTDVEGGDLIIVTSVSLLDDPLPGSDHPVAMSGSRVEARTGVMYRASAATPLRGVVVREDLRAHLEVPLFSFLPDAFGTAAGHGIEVSAPNINGGRPTPLSNESDRDAGSYTPGVVEVEGIDLRPGESASFRFQVRLQ